MTDKPTDEMLEALLRIVGDQWRDYDGSACFCPDYWRNIAQKALGYKQDSTPTRFFMEKYTVNEAALQDAKALVEELVNTLNEFTVLETEWDSYSIACHSIKEFVKAKKEVLTKATKWLQERK